MAQGRRRLKNLFVFPESQIRYGILFLALATFTHVILTVAVVKVYGDWSTEEEPLSLPIWGLVVGIFFVYFILQAFAFVLGLLMSHKIFGPIVALRNFVAELNDGKYSGLVNTRKNDDAQIRALAEELNTLAKKLNAKK